VIRDIRDSTDFSRLVEEASLIPRVREGSITHARTTTTKGPK
jgi:hypothetical protein